MMNWFIIGLVVLVVFLFFKMSHAKHKLILVTVLVLFLFFYLTFVAVANNNSIELDNPTGFFQATKAYFPWLGQAFGNFRTLGGNAVRMDWLPEGVNSTADLIPRG